MAPSGVVYSLGASLKPLSPVARIEDEGSEMSWWFVG